MSFSRLWNFCGFLVLLATAPNLSHGQALTAFTTYDMAAEAPIPAPVTINGCVASCTATLVQPTSLVWSLVQDENQFSLVSESYARPPANATSIKYDTTITETITMRYNLTDGTSTQITEVVCGTKSVNQTNAQGTATTAVELRPGVTTNLAYPTQITFVAESDYLWSGVLPTGSGNETTCASQTVATTAQFPSEPILSNTEYPNINDLKGSCFTPVLASMPVNTNWLASVYPSESALQNMCQQQITTARYGQPKMYGRDVALYPRNMTMAGANATATKGGNETESFTVSAAESTATLKTALFLTDTVSQIVGRAPTAQTSADAIQVSPLLAPGPTDTEIAPKPQVTNTEIAPKPQATDRPDTPVPIPNDPPTTTHLQTSTPTPPTIGDIIASAIGLVLTNPESTSGPTDNGGSDTPPSSGNNPTQSDQGAGSNAGSGTSQQGGSSANQQGGTGSNQQESPGSDQQGGLSTNQLSSPGSDQQGGSHSNQQGGSESNQQGNSGSNQQYGSTNPQVIGVAPESGSSTSKYVVDGQTIVAGGPTITAGGNTYAVATNGGAIVVNGVTSQVDQDSNAGEGVPIAVVTPPAGSGTSEYVIAGQTVAVGGPGIVVSGTTYSAASTGNGVLVNSVAYPVSGDGTVGGAAAPTANAAAFIFNDKTLVAGGQAVVDSGTTYALAAGGSAVVVNGATSTLSSLQTGSAVLIGGVTATATTAPTSVSNAAAIIFDGQTLVDGITITIAGTTYALAEDGGAVIINGVTSTLAPGTTLSFGSFVATRTTVPETVRTIVDSGTTYTLPSSVSILPSGGVVIDSKTLLPGSTIVIAGKTLTLDQSGSVEVLEPSSVLATDSVASALLGALNGTKTNGMRTTSSTRGSITSTPISGSDSSASTTNRPAPAATTSSSGGTNIVVRLSIALSAVAMTAILFC